MAAGKAALLVNCQYLLECQEVLGVAVGGAQLQQAAGAACGVPHFKQRLAVYAEGDIGDAAGEAAFLKDLKLNSYRVDRVEVPERAKAAHCQNRACKYAAAEALRLNCMVSNCPFAKKDRSILPGRAAGVGAALATRMLQLCYRQDVRTFVLLAGDEPLDTCLDILSNDESCEVHVLHFNACGGILPETKTYAASCVDLSAPETLASIKVPGAVPPKIVNVDPATRPAGGVPGAKTAKDIPLEIRMMDMYNDSLMSIGKGDGAGASRTAAVAPPQPAPAPAPAAPADEHDHAVAEDMAATANFFETLSMMPPPTSPPKTTAGAAPPSLGGAGDDFFASLAKPPSVGAAAPAPAEEKEKPAPAAAPTTAAAASALPTPTRADAAAEPEEAKARVTEQDMSRLPLPLPLPTPAPAVEEKREAAEATPQSSPAASPPPEPQPLPGGWTEYKDPRTGRPYYACTDATGATKTVWKRPDQPAPGAAAAAAVEAAPQQQETRSQQTQAQPQAQQVQQTPPEQARLQQMTRALGQLQQMLAQAQQERAGVDAQIAQLRAVHEQGGVLTAQQQQGLAQMMQTQHQLQVQAGQIEQRLTLGREQEAQQRVKAQQEVAAMRQQQQQQAMFQQQQQQQQAQQQQALPQPQPQPQQPPAAAAHQQAALLQQQHVQAQIVKIRELQALNQQGRLTPPQQAAMQQLIAQVQQRMQGRQ